MANFKNYSNKEKEGKVFLEEGIVKDIIKISVEEIPYVRLEQGFALPVAKKDNTVVIEKDGVHVFLAVSVHYSQAVSEIAFKIQETIRKNVESMTDYKIANVDIKVKNVYFDDEDETQIKNSIFSNDNAENADEKD